MPTASLVLPFTTSAKERATAFTPSMELAAILFLIEAKRKKRGLLETTPKKILLVSKLHYPLWAVPFENESLIVDGLGVFSSTFKWHVLPDITFFIDDIERGASNREQFRTALEKHEKTFKDFAKVEEIQIDVVVTDAELLSTISEHAKETLSLNLEGNETVVLAPLKLDQQAAVESVKKVASFYKQVQSEIRGLKYAKNLLDETVRLHEQMILKEIECVRGDYEVEISKIRPAVERMVNQLLKERDARIAKMNRIMENDVKVKERERERRERELQRLELGRASYLKRLEARKRRKDKIGVTHWKHRIRVYENKIEETKARLHALSDFIEKTRNQNKADTEKIRYGYQALIDQEKKKIIDIEIQRDRSVEAKQMEIERLKLATNRIIGQIEGLIAQKQEEGASLKKLAIPLQFEDATLVCLPLYLACYHVGNKTQFQIFPPFRVVGSNGIVKTLRKTISGLRPSSRINLLLQPRSKALSKMLDFVFEEKMKSDKAFGEGLLQSATSGNVLERQNFKETLEKGIKELKAEGWISQNQAEALINTYTHA